MPRISALCALLILTLAHSAQAQTFPDRPIRFIVPNPSGGSNDAAARILANALSELWSQGIVVENRAGGGGNVGAQAAATATADGYTLLLTSPGPLTINPSLYKRLPFDPEKDFAPIALVATVPIVLMVNPKVPANTVQDLIALARREQGRFNYASSGIGSTHHLAAELFKKMADVELQHVPYRGAAPAMNDLIAGHVPMLFDNISTVIPQVRAGNVRALAIASPQRVPSLPEVPTFAEAGMPDFEASSWFGLVAPIGTPPAVLAKITSGVRTALALPEVQRRFEETGAPVGAIFASDFGRFLHDEREKWSEVIKTTGARAAE
jgi:tripartite-type tricarboxylate transporter receptor subunit TctC